MYQINVLILLLLSSLIQSRKIDLDPEDYYCFDEELSNPQYIKYKIQNSNPSVGILVGTRIKDPNNEYPDIYCATIFGDEVVNTGCTIPENDDPQQLCVFSLDLSPTTLEIDYNVSNNDPQLTQLHILLAFFIVLVVFNCGYAAYIFDKRRKNKTFTSMSENVTPNLISEENETSEENDIIIMPISERGDYV